MDPMCVCLPAARRDSLQDGGGIEADRLRHCRGPGVARPLHVMSCATRDAKWRRGISSVGFNSNSAC